MKCMLFLRTWQNIWTPENKLAGPESRAEEVEALEVNVDSIMNLDISQWSVVDFVNYR